MTQDEIIEMARQAWISEKEAQLITEFDMAYISCTYLTDIVAFAKLVAAKEREACATLYTQLFTDPENQPTQFGTVTVEYMEREIAAEREACAKVCDAEAIFAGTDGRKDASASNCAYAIRARGEAWTS